MSTQAVSRTVRMGKCRTPKDPGSAVSWALSSALNAAHVVTPEPSFGMESGFYHRVGRNYMLALLKPLADSGNARLQPGRKAKEPVHEHQENSG